MTILKQFDKKIHSFSEIPNITAQDYRLSFEARGMLLYLLSKPPDWLPRIPDLMRQGKVGRDKCYKLIQELKQAGYWETIEKHTDLGHFGYDRRVGCLPLTEFQETVEPLPDLPDTALPDTALPLTVNQTHTKKRSTKKRSNKEKRSSKQASSQARPKAPAIEKPTAAAALPDGDERDFLLKEEGIQNPKRQALLALDWVTLEYLEWIIEDAAERQQSTGLLITRIEHHDPAPKKRGIRGVDWIPDQDLDQYGDAIKH